MTNIDENKVEDATIIIDSSAKEQFNRNYCKYCGKELQPDAAFCSSCGKAQGNVTVKHPSAQMMQQPATQPYIVSAYQQPQQTAPISTNNTTTVVVEGAHSNGIGIAGFIIALIGLVFCWIPFINIILWFLGFVFSLIGVFKVPRGMAIAGLVLSLIIIFIIISIWGAIINTLDTFFNN